jgi:hypothetical protein
MTRQHRWYVAAIATQPEQTKTPTAIADALHRALDRAIYDPRHALHRQTFGFYGKKRNG